MAPLDLFERWLARNRPHDRHEWNEHTLAPGVVVAYERNVDTNARLEEAGVEVFRISGSERGGPRCMCCPVARDAP